tara:strand:+ start:231 stop:398 length:168 start_codon:yes stop_codon:yes gene_type:complete
MLVAARGRALNQGWSDKDTPTITKVFEKVGIINFTFGNEFCNIDLALEIKSPKQE